MGIRHAFDITETKAESLYIMHVARMRPVEFLEYPVQRFLVHPDAIILYGNKQVMILRESMNDDPRGHIFPAILDGIIYQIAQQVRDMYLVTIDPVVRCIQKKFS